MVETLQIFCWSLNIVIVSISFMVIPGMKKAWTRRYHRVIIFSVFHRQMYYQLLCMRRKKQIAKSWE